jgi:hypothetical protein
MLEQVMKVSSQARLDTGEQIISVRSSYLEIPDSAQQV